MKKVFLYNFLFLIWCNVVVANTFLYNCNLNTKFKHGTDGDWKQKYVKFTISNSGEEYVKVYDHEIEVYYSPEMTIVTNNAKFIHAVAIDNRGTGLESLTINKINKYTQLVFLDGGGGSTFHFGYCK